MLIKDLSVELDAKTMTEVHGGGNVVQGITQANLSGDSTVAAFQFGAGNSIVSVVAPTQTNLASNTALNSEVNKSVFDLDITKVAVGGVVI